MEDFACYLTTKGRSLEAAGKRVIFAVNADIAKAHRRVLVRPSDWGAQACKTSSGSSVV